MHVLIIPSERYIPKEDPLSGIFQQQQAQALKRAGFRIGVLSAQLRPLYLLKSGLFGWTTGITIENDLGIPVYRYQGWNLTPYLPFVLGRSWLKNGLLLFSKYIEEQGMPDVVHAHNALFAGYLASHIKVKYGVPYVLTEHSSAYARGLIRNTDIPYIKEAYANADSMVVVSPFLGNTLEQRFRGDVGQWEWVPNVLGNKFEHQSLPDNRNKPDGTFRFLNVGSLIKIKGQEELLLAFHERFKDEENVQLHIIGEGPLRNHLQSLSAQLGITQRVFLHGQLSHDRVLEEMQRCDVYVHTSHYETFGVALIEALACGNPVISTACGGPESIVSEKNGTLVPVGDVKAIGDAMARFVTRGTTYDRNQIRQDCISRFGEKTIVDKLTIIYERISTQNRKQPHKVQNL